MIKGVYTEWAIYRDGVKIDSARSLKVRCHAPDGCLSWGYLGSGCAQAALALLLEFGATDEEALSFYQEFKREVIAVLPAGDFQMEDSKVTEWLEFHRIAAKEFPQEEK